jgi:hypothetical protein
MAGQATGDMILTKSEYIETKSIDFEPKLIDAIRELTDIVYPSETDKRKYRNLVFNTLIVNNGWWPQVVPMLDPLRIFMYDMQDYNPKSADELLDLYMKLYQNNLTRFSNRIQKLRPEFYASTHNKDNLPEQ